MCFKLRVSKFADGSKDTARFTYANDDSFQLTEVTHTHADYPATQSFRYDTRGNMLNDEQGRTLEYDLRGRLERVLEGGHEQVRYRYDGHDQLLASVHGGSREVQRRYQDHSLDTTQEGNLLQLGSRFRPARTPTSPGCARPAASSGRSRR